MNALLRLGAFDVVLERCSGPHRELLEGLFRTRVEQVEGGGLPDLRLVVEASSDRAAFGTSDVLTGREDGDRLLLTSDVVAATLDRGAVPLRLEVRIHVEHPRVRFLDHYLRIVLNAVLRRVDRLRLHAAAVEFGGSTSLFIGDKGAGKTSICLHLASRGGTVLAEDQTMVRRAGDGVFHVAGGDVLMRLTRETEAHFFARPLPEPALLLAGVPKKEIQGQDHIAFRPNCERPPERVFFPEVGRGFAIHPLSKGEALRRLSSPLTPIHRFIDDADRREFLGFLVGLVAQTDSYTLSLAPDLGKLDHLSRFLA